MAIPKNIRLFRMVHWQNVEYILQHGLCSKDHENADPDYINIGHQQLIADRHDYPINLPDAGNLGEYVPFYFAGHSPMLYMIYNGYGGVEKRSQNDIVFIVCKFAIIKSMRLEFVYTDRNAKIAVAKYFNTENDFDKLKWKIIFSKEWSNDNDNLARKDFKQAEFLIKDKIPVDCIYALVVRTEKRKEYFEQMIAEKGLEIIVRIDKNSKLYY